MFNLNRLEKTRCADCGREEFLSNLSMAHIDDEPTGPIYGGVCDACLSRRLSKN